MLSIMSRIKLFSPTFVVMVLFVLAMTGAWYFWGRVIGGNDDQLMEYFGLGLPVNSLLYGTGLLLVSAILLSIAILVDSNPLWVLIGSFAASGLAIPFLFTNFPEPNMYMFVALPAFVMFVLMRMRMMQVMKDLTPWRPSWPLREGLPGFFIGISLLLTAGVAVSPVSESFMLQPIPEQVFRAALQPLSAPIQQFVGLDINDTVDKSLVGLSGGKITDPQALALARAEYSKSLGIQLTGKETLMEAMFKAANKQATAVRDRTGELFLYGFLVTIFFTFQFLALPLKILTIIGTRIVLFLLEALGPLVIEDQPARKYFAHWKGQQSPGA